MIRFYLGLPRSGKTYKVVSDIVEVFIGDGFFGGGSWFKRLSGSKKDIKYKYLYTNVQGFKFDEINDYFDNHGIDRRAVKLDWEKFYHHLVTMHDMAKSDKSDEELVVYAQEHKIHNVLFVDDEAYMHFPDSTRDPVLTWFLGYHGHLGFDVWLITQNKKKVNEKYRLDSETFIVAQPKSKSISDNILRYFYYASDSLSDDQRYAKEAIKTRPEIYELYKSGDIHKPKKVLYKYLVYLVILLVILGVLIAFFLNHFGGNANKAAADAAAISQNKNAIHHAPGENDALFDIRCDQLECWNGDPKYRRLSYPVDLLYEISGRYKFEVLTGRMVAGMLSAIADYDRYPYKIKSYYIYANKARMHEFFPRFFVPFEEDKGVSLVKAAEDAATEDGVDINPFDS